MSCSCIVYIYAMYILLDHALCTLYDSKKCCISICLEGTEDDVVWEDLVQPPGSTGDADNTADDDNDEVDFSYENDLYKQIPNPYTEEEYQRLWASDVTAVTVTLVALTAWMMQGVAEKWLTVLNHSNGPFQDQHLFKKDDLIMSNVGSCQLLPYQINPVQNKHSLP